MKNKIRMAVLISGRGSNMDALIKACQDPSYPAEIVAVISNRPDAAGLHKAQKAGIQTAIVDHKAYQGREAFEAVLQETLQKFEPLDLVCLAGFMRILTAGFVNQWQGRMLNIHPSLLPAYKGLDTHARALADGCAQAGCTVHYVTPEMDDGPILVQKAVDILPDDTADSLAERVLEVEHGAYVEAVALFAGQKLSQS
ncbi:MAG: phosphoribosylglycinamide formyltransferase [Micavibrio sp.]